MGSGAGIEVIIPPTRVQREAMPKNLQRLIAGLRNRVETSFKEITDQMEPARHGAHTVEGLLARTVATLVAHTLLPTLRAKQSDGNRNSHNAPKGCAAGLICARQWTGHPALVPLAAMPSNTVPPIPLPVIKLEIFSGVMGVSQIEIFQGASRRSCR